MPVSRKETWFAVLIFAVVFLPAAHTQTVRWKFGYADNAFLDQILVRIRETGRPMSQINAGVYELFELITMPPEEVLALPLDGPKPAEINQFRKHTYAILYLLAPLSHVVPGRIMLPVLKTMCFFGMLAFAYFFLRKEGVGYFSAALMTVLISAHPAWSWGLYWQMYVDRLFLICGLFFLYHVTKKDLNRRYLVIVALLCLSISERMGAVCGVAMLGFAILNPRRYMAHKWLYATLALALIAVSVSIIKFYLVSKDYVGFSGSLLPGNFLLNLQGIPGFREKMLTFIVVNLCLFGFLGLFNWRAYLMALGTMAPNIMGNLGGAEKTGFSTHYHSIYLPFLVWAVITGYVSIRQRLSRTSSPRLSMLALNLLACVLMLTPLALYSYGGAGPRPQLSNLKAMGWARSLRELPMYLPGGSQFEWARAFEEVAARVPAGVVVSCGESLLPVLQPGREVHIYPEGIGVADRVVLFVNPEVDESPRYLGAVSYLGQEAERKLNLGLMTKLGELGFDLEGAEVVGSWAILAKR